MEIQPILNKKLLFQQFGESFNKEQRLLECKNIAAMYARTEHSLAVLSDLRNDKSYVYNGQTAVALGFCTSPSVTEIDSIWEEEIFKHIHPDDLQRKYLLEMQFFRYVKEKPVTERSHYHVISTIRMLNQDGKYVWVQHRLFYLCSEEGGSLWLALCLYNFLFNTHPVAGGSIVNAATGEMLEQQIPEELSLLSERETEVLSLIHQGKLSKEIATLLCISINTVNRHRQNILEKLQVQNSVQACRIGSLMQLF